MALKKLGFIDLLKAVITVVESGTGKCCYDAVPDNLPSPFYFAEIVGLRPDNTKTMFIDVFTVYIHCIAAPSDSSVGVFKLIRSLDEALTVDIVLVEPYDLLTQTSLGMVKLITDETNEKHAIMGYEFKVCYGFKVK